MENNLSLQNQSRLSTLNRTYMWQMNSIKSFFTKQIEQLDKKFNLTQSLLKNKVNLLQNQFTLYKNQSNQRIQELDEKLNITYNFRGKVSRNFLERFYFIDAFH